MPQKELKLSRKVDECKPLVAGVFLRASSSVFGVAGGIMNVILKSVVFLTVLFHILSSKEDPAAGAYTRPLFSLT